MNKEEIIEALKIVKEPITVNCVEYKYFDEENYNKMINVYQKCLWFTNNFEQINLTVENLQEENKKLKEQLQQKDEIINKAKEFVCVYKKQWVLNDDVVDDMEGLLKILDNKGE